MSYKYDVEQAALSAPAFDKANAEDIGNYHGDDPAYVLRDILAVRAVLKGDN